MATKREIHFGLYSLAEIYAAESENRDAAEKKDTMSSADFLKNNTTIREELFNYRLFYDLKRAATEREYHLKIFQSTVDFEGFDIVIDDNKKIGRYQIKSRLNANTPSWKIHANILFPKRINAEIMGFDQGLCPTYDNGIILIDIVYSDSEPKVTYLYTDFYVIKSIAKGLFDWKKSHNEKRAKAILEELLLTKRKDKRITIPYGLFLELKNPVCLLTICGFDSSENKTISYLLMELFRNNRINISNIDSDPEFSSIKNEFLNDINDLIIKN